MDSFIRWIGGKKQLRKKILEQFPEEKEYDRYIEVFGGAGWILFAKQKHAGFEVYNDINGELVNLYRCTKYHCDELQKELDGLLISREIFFDYKEQLNVRGLTDIQRAARFFVLIKMSFGADLQSFGIASIRTEAGIQYLKEAQKRLDRVVIENKDFRNLLKVYDRDNSLFYLDPPYYKTEKYYSADFGEDDHIALKDILRDIKGKFLLSYNDCTFIRELYKEYDIIAVDRQHNLLSMNGGARYKELIIKNY